MPRLVRRILGIGCGLLAVLLIITVIVVAAIAGRVNTKEDAPRSADLPAPVPVQAAAPNLQFDDFTCGFRALSAAYEVYGLSPESKNLRFRLGTDREAVPIFTGEDSRGTLHPDILRAVTQDGFTYELLDPQAEDTVSRLRSNLRSASDLESSAVSHSIDEHKRARTRQDDSVGAAQPNAVAVILIRHRGGASLHWVLADACIVEESTDAYALRIVDSVKRDPYIEPIGPYLQDKVLSIILLRPLALSVDAIAVSPTTSHETDGQPNNPDQAQDAVSAAHRAGVAEMLRVRERMQRDG